MNLQYLTATDWEHFATQFRSAESWLTHQCLVGELAYLRRTTQPNAWQIARLAELTEWERVDTNIRNRTYDWSREEGEPTP